LVSSSWIRLGLWSASALCFFRLVDGGLHGVLAPRWPGLAVVADLRISSLTLLGVAFALSAREIPLWTRGPDARTAKLIAYWLVGVLAVVHFGRFGKIPLPRWQDQVAHVLTGAIAEELLCRGLVLGAALAIWPRGWKAVAWSTAVFSLMHLQYHSFRLDQLALAQLAWTLPLGAVLATVAVRTRSLAVVMILHLVNNAIVVLA